MGEMLLAGFAAACGLALALLLVASWWRLLAKAGRRGWTALIPIYNVIALLRVARCPWWWVIPLCIPLVTVFVQVAAYYRFARAYGRDVWTLLLLFALPVVGFPVLAFGSASYHVPKK